MFPESLLWDDWHAIAELDTLRRAGELPTVLFDRSLVIRETASGVEVSYGGGARSAPAKVKYGLVWTCLGEPNREILDLPESAEPDRWVMTSGSFGIRTSGLRLVENFLDMSHLPFVHAGYLGAEPFTEVLPYDARVTSDDEILITDCHIQQPMASAFASEGIETRYVFRVLRPYTVLLHKSNALQPARNDTIMMVVQPVGEECCVGHALLLALRDGDPDQTCRWFQRMITGQDKPILESQRPRRLPLDPRAELPVRADLAGTIYRRWLSERGVRYGAIPASA